MRPKAEVASHVKVRRAKSSVPEQAPNHRQRRDQQHAHDDAAGPIRFKCSLLAFPISAHSLVDLVAVAPIFRR
jgi:hypothetical protein